MLVLIEVPDKDWNNVRATSKTVASAEPTIRCIDVEVDHDRRQEVWLSKTDVTLADLRQVCGFSIQSWRLEPARICHSETRLEHCSVMIGNY